MKFILKNFHHATSIILSQANIILLLLFPFFNANTFANPVDYSFGEETDFSKASVSPSIFPILDFGIHNRNENETLSKPLQDEFVTDFDFRISPTHPKVNNLSLKNLYYGDPDESYNSPLRFSFGRRKIGWSSLDQQWGLGQFEPLDSWDKLRSDSLGLTGIFAYSETNTFNFRFFFSYLSFPELGPNVILDHNRFVSEHPQSIASTPQTYTLLNRPTPLGYEIVIPSLTKILLRPSIAFMMETKKEIPFHYRFAYGNLPLNYFPIALEASLSIPLDQIVVKLHPRILSHHVYNNEFSFRFSNYISLGANILVDVPIEEIIPSEYTTTPLTTSINYSPWLKIQGPGYELFISQLWSRGGVASDVGPYANTNSSIFSSHIYFRNATQIAFKKSLFQDSTHEISLFTKYIHEYSIEGNWIASDLNFQLQKNFSVFIGGDIIGANKSASVDRGAELLSDLRTVDRIRGGVHYVF